MTPARYNPKAAGKWIGPSSGWDFHDPGEVYAWSGGVSPPFASGRAGRAPSLRDAEIELVALGAIVFRLLVLVMAIAVRLLAVVGRVMRIGRLDPRGRGKHRLGDMTAKARFKFCRLRVLGVRVAGGAGDARELMQVRERQARRGLLPRI